MFISPLMIGSFTVYLLLSNFITGAENQHIYNRHHTKEPFHFKFKSSFFFSMNIYVVVFNHLRFHLSMNIYTWMKNLT